MPPMYPLLRATKRLPSRLRLNGVLGSTHGPGPMLIKPTGALYGLSWSRLSPRGYGWRRIWHVPRANADKPPNAVPAASGGRRPGRTETLANGSPPGPCRPAPQEDDPGRCEAQLDPLDVVPTLLPAGVVADLGVEPDARTCRLEHPFVGRVVLGLVQRRAASTTVDGVARAERLHRRRAGT